jgi:hypothetical protein
MVHSLANVMCKVLIVSLHDLAPQLGRTVLWRSEVERVIAPPQSALEVARRLAPRLLVLEASDVPLTVDMIRKLRQEPLTHHASVVVLLRTPERPDALEGSGANLILTGEADPSLWDTRLEELLEVPPRRDLRIPVQLEVWSRLAPEGDVTEGLGLNISPRGMLLETDDALDIGTKVDLSFALPGRDDELRVVGQVVRDADGQARRPRCGVEFLILRGDARERIRAFSESQARR